MEGGRDGVENTCGGGGGNDGVERRFVSLDRRKNEGTVFLSSSMAHSIMDAARPPRVVRSIQLTA